LTTFAHTLGEVSTEHDASRTRAIATQRDYSAQVSASSSQSERCKAFTRTLEEHAALLGLQEMDLEVREAILAEELERSLHPPNGRDPSAELDKVYVCVDQIADDHAAKVEQVASILIDLGLLPVEFIPQLPKTA
jgi:hypothetical protein